MLTLYIFFSCRHWLAPYFVIWYGVPYMAYDLYAMYLSHYYRFQVKGHEDYNRHSLSTVNSFVRKEFLLVLHHIALLTVLLPVTLVRPGGGGGGGGGVRVMVLYKAFSVLPLSVIPPLKVLECSGRFLLEGS